MTPARRARAEALAEKLALMQSTDIIVHHIDAALRAEREAVADMIARRMKSCGCRHCRAIANDIARAIREGG